MKMEKNELLISERKLYEGNMEKSRKNTNTADFQYLRQGHSQ